MLQKIPQNLLSLREKYNISRALLAEMLHLKSYTSISDFESGRTIPSLPVFLAISNLFGVNMDWLAGRSDIQYSHETLLPIEERLLKESKTIPTSSKDAVSLGFMRLCIITSISLSELYTDHTTRKLSYTLPERADIVFCMQIIKQASITITEVAPDLTLYEINFPTLKEKLLPMLKDRDGKKTTTIRLALWEECWNKLELYSQRDNQLSPTEILNIKQQAYIEQTNSNN